MEYLCVQQWIGCNRERRDGSVQMPFNHRAYLSQGSLQKQITVRRIVFSVKYAREPPLARHDCRLERHVSKLCVRGSTQVMKKLLRICCHQRFVFGVVEHRALVHACKHGLECCRNWSACFNAMQRSQQQCVFSLLRGALRLQPRAVVHRGWLCGDVCM